MFRRFTHHVLTFHAVHHSAFRISGSLGVGRQRLSAAVSACGAAWAGNLG